MDGYRDIAVYIQEPLKQLVIELRGYDVKILRSSKHMPHLISAGETELKALRCDIILYRVAGLCHFLK